MSSEIKHLREFGKFWLDVQKRVLWHEGELVHLPLKQIELLCLLIESSGKVITKDEIQKKLWADSYVEESNLSRHVYMLRKAFKDFGESEELIQTVPRRGYRFTGAVNQSVGGSAELIIEKHTLTQTLIEETNESAATRPLWQALRARSRWLLIVVILSALALTALALWRSRKPTTTTGIQSIAVLPFKTLDARQENTHEGLGLADILITRLSNIKEITVRPTSAILAFENSPDDSVNVGQKLQVDAVLEGTIYRAKDQVRVTARLIRVSNQAPIWTAHFEKLVGDEMRLQNEIAMQVVDALTLNLSSGEQQALSKRYTESADAYQLYIKGRYEWNKRSHGGLSEAQRLFRNAIEKDPNFALAYVGLADSLIFGDNPVELGTALGKALDLDPHLAEAYATKGFYQTVHYWGWQEAEASFKKSIELNPGYATAHHWYAILLGIQGRNAEAKAEMQRALEINPMSYNFLADLGQVYFFNREYEKAKEYCRKALEIYPDFTFAHGYLGDIYWQTGEYETAIEEGAKGVITLERLKIRHLLPKRAEWRLLLKA